jgi:hypothetical protein
MPLVAGYRLRQADQVLRATAFPPHRLAKGLVAQLLEARALSWRRLASSAQPIRPITSRTPINSP